MKLVSEWKKAYRWFSVQIMGLIAAIGIAWPLMPDDLKAYVPENVLPIISVLAFVGILSRVIKQGPKE